MQKYRYFRPNEHKHVIIMAMNVVTFQSCGGYRQSKHLIDMIDRIKCDRNDQHIRQTKTKQKKNTQGD